MRGILVVASLIVSTLTSIPQTTGQDLRRSVNTLPEVEELANPFTFSDGSPVRSKGDWDRRRSELKGLFQEYAYGFLPDRPDKMTIQRGRRQEDETNHVTLHDLLVNLEHQGKTLTFEVRIALPSEAGKKVPVIIQGVSPAGFGRRDSAESPKHFSIFTNRGYAVAELDFQQIALDDKVRARTGRIYTLFGDKITCGALMAWAWEIHRAIDVIETLPEIDAQKVIVTGHSRYGKAALIAGAFDERIALTVPSHSGCAGTAPYRFIFGKSEQLHNIVGFAPHWFREDFNEFVGNVDRLPFDQHQLLALVAPRALLCTEGTLDAWTNPEGVQLTYEAAARVYRFLKAGDKLSIRFRPTGHVPNPEDLLDYADHVFWNRTLPEEFGKLAYKEGPNGFSWGMPKGDSDFESWPKGASPQEIGQRVAQRFVGTPLAFSGRTNLANHITYPEVCSWYGALQFARLTGDTALQTALIRRFEPLHNERKDLVPVPDHVDLTVFAAVPLELFMQTNDRRDLDMGKEMADKQWEEPFGPKANEESWEYFRKGLTWQTRMWIDDMFMITTAQAQAYRATGDRRYIDCAAKEMVVYLDELQKPNGLFYHAPDVPFFWGRGNGWMAAGMSELLRSLPEDNPDRLGIMKGYRTMMASLLKYQDMDGMWHQLIDKPDSWPETSCSAMFTFALISGVKNGWLDAETYGPAARKGWLAVIRYLDENADVREVCEGTGKKNDLQYYLDRKRNVGDLHGQAPILWCASALLR